MIIIYHNRIPHVTETITSRLGLYQINIEMQQSKRSISKFYVSSGDNILKIFQISYFLQSKIDQQQQVSQVDMQRVKKTVFFCWIRIMPIIAPKIFIILLIFLVANALDLGHDNDLINQLENTPLSQIDCNLLCNITYNYNDQFCCTDDTLTNCLERITCYPAKLQELQDQFASKKTMVIIFSCILFVFLIHFIVICCIAKKWTQEIENEAQSESDASIQTQSLLQESFLAEQKEDICVICLIEFKETRVAKLNCGHLFHGQCINQWRLISLECPICKRVHE